jgi:hypothetical protein
VPSSTGFAFTLSPEALACYTHYASFSQQTTYRSLQVDTTKYERSLQLLDDLKNLTWPSDAASSANSIMRSFDLIEDVADSSFTTGWYTSSLTSPS